MARITLVLNRPSSLSETFQRSMVDALVADGHTLTVHALDAGSDRDDTRDTGAPGHSFGLPAVRSTAFPLALSHLVRRDRSAVHDAVGAARRRFGSGARGVRAAALAAPILATRPEVIHLGFSGIGVSLLDAIEVIDEVRRVRLAVSCRGTAEQVAPVLHPERRGRLRTLFARVDQIHAVSDAMAATITDLGADPKRVRVIRPAVDTDFFSPAACGPRSGDGGAAEVVCVARLHWVKGLDDLLDAAALLRRQATPIRFTIIGDGPDGDALRFRTHALGLTQVVHFAGGLDPAGVRSALATAAVAVSTSLSEGISNSVLEAMAMGVPVISTRVGGMAEVITDGVNGLLVAPGDPTALAGAIEHTLADPSSSRSRADAARNRVVSGFGLGRLRADFASFYGALCMSD